MKTLLSTVATCLAVILISANAIAQPTAFNYQGQLSDGLNPANGSHQFQFKLYDSASGGTQIGPTVSDVTLTISKGMFSCTLDFGSNAFPGENRFLEIAVRRNASEGYVTLSPRQQIASSPYSIRTVSAAMADDSQKLGGVNATEYLTSTAAGNSFIKNQSTQQPASNFNITGNGMIGGNLGVGNAVQVARVEVSSSGDAIRGLSSGGRGVWGESNSWQGIFGRSSSNAGVVGESNSQYGVFGITNGIAGSGVYG